MSASAAPGSATSPAQRRPDRRRRSAPLAEREATATGQPASASARAVAAPMPREPPVTSAQPRSAGSPFEDPRAPHEAGAERAQHDAVARLRLGLVQRQRQRRRADVAVPLDAVDDARRVEPQPPPDRLDDPRVGLVEDEQVDVVESRPPSPPASCARPRGGRPRSPPSGRRRRRASAYRRSRWCSLRRIDRAEPRTRSAAARPRRRRRSPRCRGRRGRASARGARRRSRGRTAPGRTRAGRPRADSAVRKPVQATLTSKPAVAPTRAATSVPTDGRTSSAEQVATITRSGRTPSSARSAASVARSASRSPGASQRRSRIPVRDTIQSSSTPSRAAIGALGTTRSGTAMPRPVRLGDCPASRSRATRGLSPESRWAQTRTRSASRAIRLTMLASTLPGPASTKRSMPAACSASTVSRQRTGAVSASARRRADVGDRRGRHARVDGDARRADVGLRAARRSTRGRRRP